MPSKRSRAWKRRKKENELDRLAGVAERQLLSMDRQLPRFEATNAVITHNGKAWKSFWDDYEAGRIMPDKVCVKKLEAGPMSGELEGAVLEQALKDDLKIDPGTKHAAPRPSAPGVPKFIPPSPEVAKVLHDGLLRDADAAGEVARKKWVPPSVTSTEPVKFAPLPAPPEEQLPAPTQDLPAGMKMVLWVPIKQGDGTCLYQCSIEGFGYRAAASSRNKQKALAYALEEMAKQMLEAASNG